MNGENVINDKTLTIDELYASIEAILFAAGESVNFAKLMACCLLLMRPRQQVFCRSICRQ